jgi:hypothetical protein
LALSKKIVRKIRAFNVDEIDARKTLENIKRKEFPSSRSLHSSKESKKDEKSSSVEIPKFKDAEKDVKKIGDDKTNISGSKKLNSALTEIKKVEDDKNDPAKKNDVSKVSILPANSKQLSCAKIF